MSFCYIYIFLNSIRFIQTCLLLTPLLVSYRVRQIQKSGEDPIREQFRGKQPIHPHENEAPDWIPYSCVEQLQCVVHFFSLSYSVGLPEISGIFVDSHHPPSEDRDSDARDEELTRELNGPSSPLYDQHG